MLILARESRGFTQIDLAQKIDITQAAISKFEKGVVAPSEELTLKLSDILKFPLSFFYQPDHRYPPITPFHRKKKALPKRLQSKIEAISNIKRIHITKLLEGIELGDNKILYIDIDEYDGNPCSVAIAFRRYLRIPRGPIKNLTSLIEDIGIVIIPCHFDTYLLDGFTLITEKNQPIIFTNKDAPGDRLRFTLAHELGHIIMHSVPHEKIEEEANAFASEFLMPEEDIRPSFSRIKIDLALLASLKPYWRVSMAALLKRASDLGKITYNQSRFLWSQMSAYGYTKQEPSRLSIPQEKPTLFKEVAELYFTELGYSLEEICNAISAHPHDFMEFYPELIASKAPLRVVK